MEVAMKNRKDIKFERTAKGFTGSLKTAETLFLALGETKEEVRKEIRKSIKEF